MIFRKATEKDLGAVADIYAAIHTAEENGKSSVGWIRSIYPTYETASDALHRDDLFVAEDGGLIVGTAIINQIQPEVYYGALWEYPADDNDVMVLHTLAIPPEVSGKGYGKRFVDFYEKYAKAEGCRYLRLDTNVKNSRARAMYKKLGYKEVGTAPCEFNGIKGVTLLLLEKLISPF